MKFKGIVLMLILLSSGALYSEDESGAIGKIITEIDSYKDRTVTLNLRLKHVDRIFEKIVFYDSSNIDIEFDISGKEKRQALRDDLLNIHEGMLYSVTFRVIGTGSLGGLLGEVEGFKPVIIDLIPQNVKGSD